MTVKELIEELQKMPLNSEVFKTDEEGRYWPITKVETGDDWIVVLDHDPASCTTCRFGSKRYCEYWSF